MSELTVPRAPTVVGRTAAERFEPPVGPGAVAAFGNRLMEFGTVLEEDRLDRQMARLKVDMTRDLGALRLQVEDMGDPDAAGAAWDQGLADIRQRYEGGTDDRGRPRVDRKNAESFGLAFDDLANTHGLALGGRFLGLRQSQRAATYYEYGNVAGNAAAGADPGTRDHLYSEFDAATDAMVRAGALTPEQGAVKKHEFRAQTEGTRAIDLARNDPGAMIAALDAGEFSHLPPETQAEWRGRAEAEAARRATADQKAAEATAKERAAQTDANLQAYIDMSGHDGAIGIEVDWADPEVQASPLYGQAMAAAELRRERPDVAFYTPAQLREAIAAERADPKESKWATERQKVLEDQLATATDGWRTDPVAFARDSGFAVPALPEFDPANPQGFADALAARVTFAKGLQEQGYTDRIALLDREEQAALKDALAVTADPAQRAALAGTISGAVMARGGNPALIEGLAADPVLAWAGGGIARGAIPQALATEILAGQQAMKEQNVVMPPYNKRLQPVFNQIGTLFSGQPGGDRRQAQLMAAADALYARRAGQLDPDANFDEDLYKQSLHEVMGGTGPFDSDTARGGVQKVEGRLTILDPGINAADVEDTLAALATQTIYETTDGGMSPELKASRPWADSAPAAWAKASRTGGQPVINGEPLTADDLADLTIEASGADTYLLILGDGSPIADSATGRPFQFSLKALMREYGR